MGTNNLRLTRRHGFITLWALVFMGMMMLFISFILTSQAAQRVTSRELIRRYDQSTKLLNHEHLKRAQPRQDRRP